MTTWRLSVGNRPDITIVGVYRGGEESHCGSIDRPGQSKNDKPGSLSAQQPVKQPSTPTCLPTMAMKLQLALAVNPDPLLFLFSPGDSAAGAQHYCVCLGESGCIFGWPVDGLHALPEPNSPQSNTGYHDHNDCRSLSGDDTGHIGIVWKKHTSAKRLMRAGLINQTVGNCNRAHQHFGRMWYTSIAKSKPCHIPLISTPIISGFVLSFHPQDQSPWQR